MGVLLDWINLRLRWLLVFYLSAVRLPRLRGERTYFRELSWQRPSVGKDRRAVSPLSWRRVIGSAG